MTVTRPVLRWHGGKWKLAPWIIEQFPSHQVYVEPFGGAASVLLRKERAYAEVYNDLDAGVVNLFSVLRSDRAGELIEAVRMTPYSRSEFALAYATSDDELEAARRLIVRSFMGFGANGHSRVTGFRGNTTRTGTIPAHDWAGLPVSLSEVAARFAGVVVESRDASAVMAQHDGPNTLHYVDPPYVFATRSDLSKDYAVELSDDEHAGLLARLRELRGMVVLSGYTHPLYDDALSDWQRLEKATFADGAKPRTEVLWINPHCWQRLNAERAQLSLLDGAA